MCCSDLIEIEREMDTASVSASTVTANAENQSSQSARRLSAIRQAIASSTSTNEIQAKLKTFLGNNAALTPTQLRTPIKDLRKQLLVGADQAANVLQQRLQAQSSFKPDRLIRETIRITILALLYGAAFAFLAGALPRSGPWWVAHGWVFGKQKS